MPYRDPKIAKQKAAERYQRNIEARKAKMRENYEKNREDRIRKAKEYVESNREKVSQYQKKWREENKDLLADYKREYYEENKQELISKSVRYKRENKDIARKIRKKYEATEKGRESKQIQRNARRKREKVASLNRMFHKDVLKVYRACKEMCRVTGNPYEVDHIVLIQGKNVCGLHVPWNLQIIPQDMNRRKTNKWNQ